MGEEQTLVVVDSSGASMVFGEAPPSWETTPVLLGSDAEKLDWSNALGKAATAGNLLASAEALRQGQSLVRLAPETMAALRSGHDFVRSGGMAIGVLQKGGQISHVARFAPIGIGGAAVMAAPLLMVGLSLAAIQNQIARTRNLVKRNIALTEEAIRLTKENIRLTHQQDWTQVRGHWEAVHAEMDNAVAIGAVTEAIWAHAQAQSSESALRGQRQTLLEEVVRLQGRLAQTPPKERLKWVAENQDDVLRICYSLLLADDAWFTYQGLRLGYLSHRGSPEDLALRDKIMRDAFAGRDAFLAQALPLVDAIYRATELAAHSLHGQRNEHRFGTAAASVADQIASISLRTHGAESVGKPPRAIDMPVPGLATDHRDVLPDLFRWLPERDEELLALARISLGSWSHSRGYVMLTDRRLLVLHDDYFRRDGTIAREFTLDEITSVDVRPGPGPMGGPDLTIETTNGDPLTIQFDKASSRGFVESIAEEVRKPRPSAGPGPTVSEFAETAGIDRVSALARLSQVNAIPVLGRIPVQQADAARHEPETVSVS